MIIIDTSWVHFRGWPRCCYFNIHLSKCDSLIVSALALVVGTNAAMSASEVQSNIDAIIQKSAETKDVAQRITLLNAASKGPVSFSLSRSSTSQDANRDVRILIQMHSS
jgi:hypothetical protein